MSALHVVEPGLATTLQDRGRIGFASIGTPRGGAADELSLRAGARLLGDATATALEMTIDGGAYRVEGGALVCLAGAATPEARVESPGGVTRPLRTWTPTPIEDGETIRVGRLEGGARCCLCVAGGIDAAPVLSSRSTHVGARLGPIPRPLRSDDRLSLGRTQGAARVSAPDADVVRKLNGTIARRALRVVPGAHAEAFGPDAVTRLAAAAFRVAGRSDRTGVVLEGDVPPAANGARLRSEGMAHGFVQATPDGRAIALGPDHPTTGGYPVIACIVGADLPSLGQAAPGDEVRFEPITRERAVELLRQREALIERVPCPRPAPDHDGGRR